MPEGSGFQFGELPGNTSLLVLQPAMEDTHLCGTVDQREEQDDSLGDSSLENSTTSLDTLLALPDIIVPPPIFNPLPLQCLAANALPKETKDDIERTIYQCYSDHSLGSNGEGLCGLSDPVEVDTLDTAAGCDDDATVERILLSRQTEMSELANDLGIGVSITGGVRCDCGTLHAVITDIEKSREGSPEFQEGACVMDWCGMSLQDASFEQVKRVFRETADLDEIEMSVKVCRLLRYEERQNKKRQTGRKSKRNIAAEFPLSSENLRRDSVLCEQDTIDENSTLKRAQPAETSHQSRTHLERATSDPHSLSTKPHNSSTAAVAQRPISMVLPPRGATPMRLTKTSTLSCGVSHGAGFNDFFSSLPKGMVKLSLHYVPETESLRVSLRQVKLNSTIRSQENQTDFFINTYLLPDSRQQGVISCKVQHNPAEQEDLTTYNLREDELEKTALRVILWEQGNGKGSTSTFQGEVLLGLSDSEEVDLSGIEMWFPVCQEDPNMPRLPEPVYYKQKKGREHTLTRFKRHLNQRQERALNYLRQHTIKPSELLHAMGAGGHDAERVDGTATSRKRQKSLSKKRLRLKAGSYSSDSGMSPETETEDTKSDSDKTLSKLSAVIRVLRDTNGEEEYKKSRLSSIFDVLRDPPTPRFIPLESPDSAFRYDFYLSDEDEEGGCSTLDRRHKRQQEQEGNPFSTIPGLRGSLGAGKKNKVTVYSFLEELGSTLESKFPTDEECEGASPDSSQPHYKLCDEQLDQEVTGVDECSVGNHSNLDSTLSSTISSLSMQSDCSCYSGKLSLNDTTTESCVDRQGMVKYRSQSTGDMLDLDDDGTSFSPCTTESSLGTSGENTPEFSALDFRMRHCITPQPQRISDLKSGKNATTIWGKGNPQFEHKGSKSIGQWKSLEDVFGSRQTSSKPKKKDQRKFTYKKPPQTFFERRTIISESGKSVGSLKLDFRYEENPPLLTVALTDVLFLPTKGLHSDFTLKAALYHNSTGVCLTKQKCSVSLKSVRGSFCLAQFHFDTDTANLSLQVTVMSGGKILSRKVSALTIIDLDSLHMSQRKESHPQWFHLTVP